MIDVTVKGFENLAKAFESANLSADKLRQALTVGISQAADAAAALEEDRRFMGRRPVPMTPIEPRWDVTKGAKWDSSATSLMVLAASAGDFTVPHGLGVIPDAAFIRECTNGEINFQASQWDQEKLYLWASARGVQARIEMLVLKKTAESAEACDHRMQFTNARGSWCRTCSKVLSGDPFVDQQERELAERGIASTHRFVGGSIDGQEQYCDDCGKLFDDPRHAVLGWDSGSSSTVREQEPSRLAATKRKFRKL